MKKIGLAVFALLLALFAPVQNASALGTIDLSAYTSETLEEAFTEDGITFDFSTSSYDESNTTNKTIIYLARKNGCLNCKNFLNFIANELLPNYADKFVVKSYEISQHQNNYNLISKLATFYGQPFDGGFTTPAVAAGTTFSTGFVDAARQAEIKSVITSGDTYDAVAAINAGASSYTSGSAVNFNDQNVQLHAAQGFNDRFSLRVTPIDRSSVVLNGYEYIKAYDISLYNYSTKVAVKNNNLQITLPVNNTYASYRVAYVENGQIVEEFDVTRNNDTISFTTTHLSEYVIYGNKSADANKTNATTNLPNNPKTADPVMIYGSILAFGIIALTTGIIGYRKLNRR